MPEDKAIAIATGSKPIYISANCSLFMLFHQNSHRTCLCLCNTCTWIVLYSDFFYYTIAKTFIIDLSLFSYHQLFSRNLPFYFGTLVAIKIIFLTIFSCAFLSLFVKECLFISIVTWNRLIPILVVSKLPSFLHRMSAPVIFVSPIILLRQKL